MAYAEGVAEGNASGVADVSIRPQDYTQHFETEVNASIVLINSENLLLGRVDGIEQVIENPGSFQLVTQVEYQAAQNLSSQLGQSDGEANGSAYAMAYPRAVGLYTEYEVSQGETQKYGADYWSGHADGLTSKLAEIRTGLSQKGLSKVKLAGEMDLKFYTRGWYYQPEWGWMFTREDVFPFVYRAGNVESPGYWLQAGQVKDQREALFYHLTEKTWGSPGNEN